MSIGVWEPASARPATLKAADWRLLRELAALPADAALRQPVERQAALAYVMKLPAEEWRVAADLDGAEIEALARFFTLAEMRFAGWQAGKSSPVIPLVKLLRARGAFTKELRQWVKANTDNRYLPYGSAL